jgi:hypothetical protein
MTDSAVRARTSGPRAKTWEVKRDLSARATSFPPAQTAASERPDIERAVKSREVV